MEPVAGVGNRPILGRIPKKVHLAEKPGKRHIRGPFRADAIASYLGYFRSRPEKVFQWNYLMAAKGYLPDRRMPPRMFPKSCLPCWRYRSGTRCPARWAGQQCLPEFPPQEADTVPLLLEPRCSNTISPREGTSCRIQGPPLCFPHSGRRGRG